MHQTPNARHFGTRREKDDPLCPLLTVMMSGPCYGPTCAGIIAFARRHFQGETTEVSDTNGKVQLQTIDLATIQRNGWNGPLRLETLPSAFFPPETKAVVAKANLQGRLDPADYPAVFASLKRWREADPKAVAEFQLGQSICIAQRVLGRPSGFWELTVRVLFDDGKAYALSRYLIAAEGSSLYNMVAVVHQNLFLIERTLNEISGIFDLILKAETQEEFKHLLARFSFLFAHCTSVARGNAAILEWFLHAICLERGANLSIAQTSMVDLEAFAHPLLSEFEPIFNQMVTLS